jgi:hypothetical protein
VLLSVAGGVFASTVSGLSAASTSSSMATCRNARRVGWTDAHRSMNLVPLVLTVY